MEKKTTYGAFMIGKCLKQSLKSQISSLSQM